MYKNFKEKDLEHYQTNKKHRRKNKNKTKCLIDHACNACTVHRSQPFVALLPILWLLGSFCPSSVLSSEPYRAWYRCLP